MQNDRYLLKIMRSCSLFRFFSTNGAAITYSSTHLRVILMFADPWQLLVHLPQIVSEGIPCQIHRSYLLYLGNIL